MVWANPGQFVNPDEEENPFFGEGGGNGGTWMSSVQK